MRKAFLLLPILFSAIIMAGYLISDDNGAAINVNAQTNAQTNDLVISQSAPDYAEAGKSFITTVTVKNNGPKLHSVTVSHSLTSRVRNLDDLTDLPKTVSFSYTTLPEMKGNTLHYSVTATGITEDGKSVSKTVPLQTIVGVDFAYPGLAVLLIASGFIVARRDARKYK
jgi:hypothetical protein